jgi:Family of unknown function (DUF5681)
MIGKRPQRVKKHQKQPGTSKEAVPKHLVATAWKPGESGNPRGRPLGARQRISEQLIADIADVWETYGRNVLRRLAAQDPATLAKIAYGLLPKDIFIQVAPSAPGNLSPQDWVLLVELVTLIKASAPPGATALPSEIVPAIEETVRAHFAKPIEG